MRVYEYVFMIKTMKGDTLQFNKTFQYVHIYDLLCVNSENFNKHISKIYPS